MSDQGPVFGPENDLPPARPGRRQTPSIYREEITACLRGEIRSTRVATAHEARLVIKRLRRAGDALNAQVQIRTVPEEEGQIKIVFTATQKGSKT